MSFSMTKLSTALLLTSSLVGCAAVVKTPYETPAVQVPGSFQYDATKAKTMSADQYSDRWWTLFGDAQLNQLVSSHQAGDDIAAACNAYPSASGVLLDTYVEGVPGGTGEAFDWSLIPPGLSKPIILAGGLTPANVAEAIARVRPYAVDVSGGVEQGKGIKDHAKIHAFINAVRKAPY